MTPDLLVFCALVVATGAVVGLLAGLLGIGGGLILVPVLFELMQRLGADDTTAVRTAIATSLATVMVTGTRSAVAHFRRGSLDRDVVMGWAPPIIVGALVGAELANRVDTSVLVTFFAIMTVVLAVNMSFERTTGRFSKSASLLPRLSAGGFVGFVASMMGVGVAGLGVPLMALFGVPVRKAVAAVALLGAMAALPATIRFLIGGWSVPDLAPYSLGYINLLGFLLIVPMAIIAAPIGVAMSHRYSQLRLKRIFALFLGLNAVRMLFF